MADYRKERDVYYVSFMDFAREVVAVLTVRYHYRVLAKEVQPGHKHPRTIADQAQSSGYLIFRDPLQSGKDIREALLAGLNTFLNLERIQAIEAPVFMIAEAKNEPLEWRPWEENEDAMGCVIEGYGSGLGTPVDPTIHLPVVRPLPILQAKPRRTLESYTDAEKIAKFDDLYGLAEMSIDEFKDEMCPEDSSGDYEYACFEAVMELLGEGIWAEWNAVTMDEGEDE